MGQTIWGIGLALVLVFMSSVYAGYTKVLDAGATLTATVKHAIAGSVMKPANSATGGGYINEQIGGAHLALNLSSLMMAVANQLPQSWQGSSVAAASNGGLLWTLPVTTRVGYNITGPVTISAVTESSSAQPTLTATVAIPIQVPIWAATWSGVIHRQIVIPLAGQTGPNHFVPYASSATTYPVPPQLTGTGIPLGTTASASSSLAANPPVSAIDGNLNTWWNSQGYSGTLTLEFTAPQYLTSFGVAATALPSTTEQYTILGQSDQGTWNTIGTDAPHVSQHHLEYFTIAVTPGQYSAVRFVINGGSSFIGINDITVNPPVTSSERAL